MESEKSTDLESEMIFEDEIEDICFHYQDIKSCCDADERSPEKKKMKMSLGESSVDVEGVKKMENSSGEEEEDVENMGDGPLLVDSSDEELSDSDKAAFYEYRRQMNKSGGFDLDYFPHNFQITHFTLDPLEEGSERHRYVCHFSEIAINQYNSDHDTNYKFVKYVKSVWTMCSGEKYYITFEAKQGSDDAPTTFQALVWHKIPNWEGDKRIENIQVLLVRKKSEATTEDNHILLC